MTLHCTHSSTTVCDFKPYIIALMYQYILEWTKCVWTFNLNQPTKNTKLFKKKINSMRNYGLKKSQSK